MPRILIIRSSFFKDIVLLSNLFRCIKLQLPAADIHFLTNIRYESLVVNNPYIDQCLFIHEHPIVPDDCMSKAPYDIIVDLENSKLSRKLKKALKAKAYTLQTPFISNHLSLKRIFKVVAPLGIVYDGAGAEYFIAKKDEVSATDIPAPHQMGYIAILLQGESHHSQLFTANMQALCLAVSYPIILVGSANYQQVGDQIASVDSIKVYNAAGKFSINESADLIRRSKLTMSSINDFSLLAAAYKRPLIMFDFSVHLLNRWLFYWGWGGIKNPVYIQQLVQQIRQQLGISSN